MIEFTTLRIWIGVSIAWLLLWILVFDRWFLFSPLGLLFTFVIPIAGWACWWKFYRTGDREAELDGKVIADNAADILLKLKKRFIKQG